MDIDEYLASGRANGRTKLAAHDDEIRRLHARGASIRGIANWLKMQHGVEAATSTVHYYVTKTLKKAGADDGESTGTGRGYPSPESGISWQWVQRQLKLSPDEAHAFRAIVSGAMQRPLRDWAE
jgi:hypothetical protein